MREHHEMTGCVRIILKDTKGEWLVDKRVHNRIVNSGRLMMANLFAGLSNDTVTHMAIGTSADETTDEMEGLLSECTPLGEVPGRSVLSGKETIQEENTDYTISVSAIFSGDTFTESEDIEVREAGLYTGEAGGIIYNRVTFDPVPIRPGYEITLIWDITFPG